MTRHMRRAALTGAAIALVAGATEPASAQSVEEFYKGRTVTMVVATGPGGGYEAYARPLSKYMADHLPGKPSIVLQFMPGAGGAKAANYLFTVSPRDGSSIGLISNTAPVFQVLSGGVRYDSAKFNYLGRADSMQHVVMVWHTAGVKSLEDMKEKEVIFGSTGKSQANYIVPILLKNMLGLKARVVVGYPATKEINMAMERGEMSGRSGPWGSWIVQEAGWIRDKKVIPVAQVGFEKIADLPDVPLLLDYAKTAEEREVIALLSSDAAVGRSFVAPPEVPRDRVEALRRAFDASMKDPAFIAEAKKRNLSLDPMTGEKLQEIVVKTVAAPANVVARAKKVLEWD